MTNEKFAELMKLNKHFENQNIILPSSGEKAKPYKILSDTTHDIFFLDIDRRSSITLTKKKLQKRHCQTNTMMIRLEIDCKPHMYADGTLSSRNHIHIFDESLKNVVYDPDGEYGRLFSDINNFMAVFADFCSICNINIEPILIQGVM